MSHFQDFIFDLDSSNEVACTYLGEIFPQIADVLYSNCSRPLLTVFLFSVVSP